MLTRKEAPCVWTDKEGNAIKDLQQVLTSYPLLTYPNFKLEFTLITDASRIGLGAVLMQDQGKRLQQVNRKTVSNYGITDLECGAVVWAVKLFKPYLYGRRFHVIIDHVALRWLMTSRNLTGRLHRWAISLQEFDFDVTHQPGRVNVVAAALSRAPVVLGQVPVETSEA